MQKNWHIKKRFWPITSGSRSRSLKHIFFKFYIEHVFFKNHNVLGYWIPMVTIFNYYVYRGPFSKTFFRCGQGGGAGGEDRRGRKTKMSIKTWSVWFNGEKMVVKVLNKNISWNSHNVPYKEIGFNVEKF